MGSDYRNKNKVNQSGMSLVEVVIATGVLAMVALGMTTTMTNTLKIQKGIFLTDSLQNLTARMRMSLAQPAICSHNVGHFTNVVDGAVGLFDGGSLSTVRMNVSKLDLPSGVNLVTNGEPLHGEENTRITITMDNFQELVAGSQYMANLNFALQKDVAGLGSVMGVTQVQRKVPIRFSTEGSGSLQTIKTCAVSEDVTLNVTQIMELKSELCESMGGVPVVSGSNVTCNRSLSSTEISQMCSSIGGSLNLDGTSCSLPAGLAGATGAAGASGAGTCASVKKYLMSAWAYGLPVNESTPPTGQYAHHYELYTIPIGHATQIHKISLSQGGRYTAKCLNGSWNVTNDNVAGASMDDG